MTDVRVSKGLLIGLGVAAGGSLLALAFVMGRESGSGSAPPPPTKIERVAQRPQEAPVTAPTQASAPIAGYADTRPVSVPTPEAAAGPVSVPNEGERNSGGVDPMRAAVAAYFDTIERIQVGSMSGEAESVAHEMASALASGDASSLDKMIRDTEGARARLAAVVPPAPCTAHHRESVASLDDALELLRALKSAMESSDAVAQLGAVTAQAQTLRARADALQKEEAALRERYGLRR